MALECARQRKASLRERGAARTVRLCSTHRLLRGQAFDDPELRPHFRLFGLCSAGRDCGGWQFELDSLVEHIGIHLRLIGRFPDIGLSARRPRVSITPLDEGPTAAVVEQHALARLRQEFPDAAADIGLAPAAGRGYYASLRFAISVTAPGREEFELVGGGFTRWTQLLLSDRKERMLISGFGTERACSICTAESR